MQRRRERGVRWLWLFRLLSMRAKLGNCFLLVRDKAVLLVLLLIFITGSQAGSESFQDAQVPPCALQLDGGLVHSAIEVGYPAQRS